MMRRATLVAALALTGCGRAPPLAIDAELSLVGELPRATRGAPYVAQLLVEPESEVPVVFEILEGRLPPGLELRPVGPNALEVGGIPLDAGAFAFFLSVRGRRGELVEGGFELSIEVGLPVPDAPLLLDTVRLPDARESEPYREALRASGGIPPYVFSAASPPPSGLVVQPSGRVEGVPEAPSLGSFDVRLEDDIGQLVVASVAIDVLPDDVPRIAAGALPTARVFRSYTTTLVGEGGDGGPYAWRLVQGRFPPGVDLRLRQGRSVELSGSPRDPGRFDFVVELADQRGVRGRSSLSLEVLGPLEVITEDLPVGRLGTAYAAPLVVDNVLPPLEVELAGGSLPPGVRPTRITPERFELSGVVGGRGTFRFELRFSDATDVVRRGYVLSVPR